MISAFTGFFGLGLLGLWVVGLVTNATPWLTWLDMVAALTAGLVAHAVRRVKSAPGESSELFRPVDEHSELSRAANESSELFRAAVPFSLGMALIVYWVIGISTNTSPWLSWWNFAFGFAFAIVGLSGFRLSGFPREGYGAAADYHAGAVAKMGLPDLDQSAGEAA